MTDDPLELTEEELKKLIPGAATPMSETGSALINLKTLTDDDLGILLVKIQEEQERRKWKRIQELLTQHFFPLSIPDLHRIQELISVEIQNREGSPLGTEGYDGKNAKDSLTGQFGEWTKRSAAASEDVTIDVEVSS
ncbi:MAG: hypothetical protein RLZZ435_2161 [Cyanobacteriota bacterium]|jgi:hypothetical protein